MRGKKKSMMAFVLAKYMQIEAPSASRVQDVLLVPSPQLLALLWKERRKDNKKKASASVGGGKHALSAVVLHPVKACVALCIITSTYIINSLPPSLISILS